MNILIIPPFLLVLGLFSWLAPLPVSVSFAGLPSATLWWTFPRIAPCPGWPWAPSSRPGRPTRGRRRWGPLTRRSSSWGNLTSREGRSWSRRGSPSGQWSVSPAGSSPRAWSWWRGCSPSPRNTRCKLLYFQKRLKHLRQSLLVLFPNKVFLPRNLKSGRRMNNFFPPSYWILYFYSFGKIL